MGAPIDILHYLCLFGLNRALNGAQIQTCLARSIVIVVYSCCIGTVAF